MSTLHANGIDVHVQTLESSAEHGGTVVMIHGLGPDTLASWYLTLAAPVNNAGRRVIMYDLRGHGHSERPATGYRIDDFVDDLDGLLAGLGVEHPVSLLGNSFGGTIAFGYAARHPDRVRAIVAIEAAPGTQEWLAQARSRLEKAPGRGRYAATTLVRDLSGSRPAEPEELARITCPILCVYGAESRLAGAASVVSRWLPHARVVVLPEHRHTVLIDAPEQVGDLVLPWLDLVEGRHPHGRTEPRTLDHRR